MLDIELTRDYKEDIDKLASANIDLSELDYVIGLLANSKKLNKKYSDHLLRTRFQGTRECHIEDDWLLIYKADKHKLTLIATSTHAELFDR